MQRLRYFGKLHLSVPTDLNTFCAGGSHTLTLAVVQVKEEQNINETITKGDPIIQKLWPVLRECHNRDQKSNKNRIKIIASIQPALLEMIYQELILDSSIASHSDTVQRNLPMLIGSERLVANLRHLNPGRPWEQIRRVLYSHEGIYRRVICCRRWSSSWCLTNVSKGIYRKPD